MSKLSTTMKMVSGSTSYQISFYTTTEEASAYGTYGIAEVDGTKCYYGLGTGVDAAHGSEVMTPFKINKNGVNYYMLTECNTDSITYTLTLSATSNQTITLKYKNRKPDGTFEPEVTKTSTSSSQSFTVNYGTTWTAIVSASTYYTAGELYPGTSGTVTSATTIGAYSATWTQTYTLTLAGTSNQTITLKYKNRNSYNSGYESEVTQTSKSSNQSFTVRRGTTWTATIRASSNFTAGVLSASSGTVNANTTVSAGPASAKVIVLTDDNYQMRSIYLMSQPDYSTMTSIPNPLDISQLTTMDGMFSGCSSLTSLDLSNWDTSNVIDMRSMFAGCSRLEVLDVSNFDTSRNDYIMGQMFNNCSSLQYLIIGSSTFKFQIKDTSSGAWFYNYGSNLKSSVKILVPNSLLDTYKSAIGWSAGASQFYAIENYTIQRSNGKVTVTPK